MIQKNMDMIVANDVSMNGAGFGTDTNIVQILFKDNTSIQVPQTSKQDLSKIILNSIKEKFL